MPLSISSMDWLIPQSLFGSILIGSLGLIALVLASDRVVVKLILLSKYLGISTTFLGMTIFSIATSLPEISSHIIASVGILSGSLDYTIASSTVIGANIGSDIVQQTFIIGLVVMIGKTLFFDKKFLLRDFSPMIITILMCIALGFDGVYSRLDGLILFGPYIAYTYFLYRKDKDGQHEKPLKPSYAMIYDIFVLLFAFVVMFLGAYVALNASEFIVHATGIGGSLIGIISLGVASALPELITSVVAILKKDPGISLGTLVGSNIVNPLMGIGGGALISSYWVPNTIILFDLPAKLFTGLLLLVYIVLRKGKLDRLGGFFLMALYLLYIVIRIKFFPSDIG